MSAFAEEMDNNCVNGSAQAENVFFPGREEPLRENPPRISGQWVIESGGKKYQYDNGDFAIGWSYIDDHWYFFDENGYMQTGWLLNNLRLLMSAIL